MRRATASVLIGLAIVLGSARPASAQWGIIKWLEGLSGPGHFTMWSVESHFGCIKKAQPEAEQASRAAFDTGPTPLKIFFCDQNPTLVKGTDREVWRDVGLYFTAAYAQSFAGDDPLEYPAGLDTDDTSVKTFMAGAAYRVNRWVDAGMTAGNAHFTGATSTSFNKFVLTPNVVVRPLACASRDWQDLVSVRLDFQVFPAGFTDAEFGATSNRLSGDAELVTSLVVGVNFARFLGWK